MNVYVHEGPDDVLGLYSRQNRRLLALLMFQVYRRNVLVRATEALSIHMDVAWADQVEGQIWSGQGPASPPSSETHTQLHGSDVANSSISSSSVLAHPTSALLLHFGSPPTSGNKAKGTQIRSLRAQRQVEVGE